MSVIEFLFHLTSSFGNYVHDFLVKHHLGCGELFSGRTNLPVGNLTSPRVEIGPDLEILELLADCQTGFLQDILSVASRWHKSMNVGKNPALVLHH
jgi:hypothetical protein